ncbi:phiSA1p31-related protein [Streptomyces sp. Z26]|uniref:phiSA1p31-related protein n=1 Tax=Streptomyces sp. Z26 TaxID=2500177 RepID=UPI000EF15CD1|nr:phiSA1p31-related protein [Streptomyces sp. Z26]RLL66967.1 hypothetical protein D7M15_08910 [Streptomyces sp. Z26]
MNNDPIYPDAYRLLLTVDDQGRIVMHHRTLCPHLAVTALRIAADVIEARQGDGDGELVDLPVNSRDGHLDTSRRVWTDGAGHAWNLGLDWVDITGHAWRWTGDLDPGGRAPMMRAATGDETEPLDVLRAVYGPISPAPQAGDA